MSDINPALDTPTDLNRNATASVADALNGALADCYALYLKTKNFHWHVSGPHFRDYHLMLDDQATQILGVTDATALAALKESGLEDKAGAVWLYTDLISCFNALAAGDCDALVIDSIVEGYYM